MKNIIVYGTLKKDNINNPILGNDAVYCGEVTVKDFTIYGCGYMGDTPFAIKDIGKKLIGELWKVNDVTFNIINNFERNNFYFSVYVNEFDAFIWCRHAINLSYARYIGEKWIAKYTPILIDIGEKNEKTI